MFSIAAAIFRLFPQTAKNHLAGGGLQHAGHRNIGVAANQAARVINHDHGAVIEIRHALVILFALFQNEHAHRFAGKHDRLERIGQLVDVEHADAAKLGNFVEIEIVGDDYGVELFAQLDQFEIYFAHGGKIGFDNLNVERAVVLQTIEHVQT